MFSFHNFFGLSGLRSLRLLSQRISLSPGTAAFGCINDRPLGKGRSVACADRPPSASQPNNPLHASDKADGLQTDMFVLPVPKDQASLITSVQTAGLQGPDISSESDDSFSTGSRKENSRLVGNPFALSEKKRPVHTDQPEELSSSLGKRSPSLWSEATPLFERKGATALPSGNNEQSSSVTAATGSSGLIPPKRQPVLSKSEDRSQLISVSPLLEGIGKAALPNRNFDQNTVGQSTRSSDSSPGTGAFKQGALSRVVSITYEEIGLFPRSFSRVLDRFLKQVFSDVENLVIQEYRFYRYLFLTTLKCLFIFIFVPVFVNFLAKTYIVRPLTEYFWNTKQTEIFLNYYQQKRAFAELKDFEEKIYFESLIYPKSALPPPFHSQPKADRDLAIPQIKPVAALTGSSIDALPSTVLPIQKHEVQSFITESSPFILSSLSPLHRNFSEEPSSPSAIANPFGVRAMAPSGKRSPSLWEGAAAFPSENDEQSSLVSGATAKRTFVRVAMLPVEQSSMSGSKNKLSSFNDSLFPEGARSANSEGAREAGTVALSKREVGPGEATPYKVVATGHRGESPTESLINSYTLKSSLFVYQTKEADKNIQQRYQEKTIELAQRYNDESIEAITNFFADLMSLCSLFYLLYALEIQINITKSFLLEVFFGLDDSKKSLLILLVTDLLVGYHSSNLWELFFESLFHHYGLPESQTGIFLLVATLPVLLDVLFKYLIFRHLNRSSPATVATYHAMIE